MSLTKIEIIRTQKRPVQSLTKVIEKGTFPNAFLFTGIEGCGKFDTALFFAASINCEEKKYFNECNCSSCRRILKLNHQDIIIANQKEKIIKIDEIRAINKKLTSPAYEAKKRVVIIPNAQRLNKEASNALLKNLEEPPQDTLFILTTIQKNLLLSTIVSRCTEVQFSPLPKELIKSFLKNESEVEKTEEDIIANLAEGSLNLSLKIGKKSSLKKRSKIITLLNKNSTNSFMAFIEDIKNNKKAVEESFKIINSYLKDLIICKTENEPINKEFEKEIKERSNNLKISEIIEKIELVRKTEKKIENNGSVSLSLTDMFLKF